MTSITITKEMRKAKFMKFLSKASIYAMLFVFAAWILLPFSVILSTSLKPWQEANSLGFSFIPKNFTLEGYINAITFTSFMSETSILLKGFMNTLLYVVPTTVIGLLLSSISGYAFAKINFKGKNWLFTFLIITMLI